MFLPSVPFFPKDTPLVKFADIAVIPYYKKIQNEIPEVSFERWKFVMSLFYMFAFVTHADLDHIDDLGKKISPSIERYEQRHEHYKLALYNMIKDIGPDIPDRPELEGVWIAANLWVKEVFSLTKANIFFGKKIAAYVVNLVKNTDGETLLG